MPNKKDYTNGLPDPSQLKEEMLAKYPRKVAKKRSKAMVINDPEENQEIAANIRTIPGIITQRGCTYAGCKGVVLGPTRDIINLVHGPIGCSFYAWLTRRNQTRVPEGGDNFITYSFSTDMQDENIVFGGEKKLKDAIREAVEIFNPSSIGIFSTCPVGLIGDDVHAVAREMKEETGINIFGFSCEGYRGVSQSAGHHIANNGVFKNVVGNNDRPRKGKFQVNLLGEYNIGGDAFEIEALFEEVGVELLSTFSGNSTIESMEYSHTADLNMVMCHRSINYIAEMMEEKYGIPWFKVNFIGAESTAKSLRKMADYFGDKELSAKVEEVIAREMAKVKAVADVVKPKTEGKLAMMFVGGSRAHHYQDLFTELGVKTVSAGYEFAHRDDYEGREVIPNIKIDADTRNIEDLVVEKDEAHFRDDLVEKKAKLEESGYEFKDYKGMMPDMQKNSLVIDDVNHWETEKLIEFYKPDVFCAGIKEKYVVQKYGVPLKQLHSYDYGGPYAAFGGAINFYNEMERMLGTKIWKLVDAPWKLEPEIVGSVTVDA
ncbi:nitrogenase molybdenum-iron protein alpha chain [Draconibacterium sp. IB214405]|uniref:nitrogenase molybdenum-iron protein alpha chain n=1 Tax=Draconibacterium sp. IB214405 TaxID=3097352 RepID=UPI002A0ECCF5|nr:nitrogenase molybdenum-iron protein alpha chain [Draconibacterium sp. IB214405]MDX8341308.1 nitrogenase molybdenum-iron protein alpha chain [Draconibacterium sp. IB214405]